MVYKVHTQSKKLLADTLTPVSIYLKLRDKYPGSILLESSDYHGNENSYSFICCKPIASIVVENETVTEKYPDGTSSSLQLKPGTSVVNAINDFSRKFQP